MPKLCQNDSLLGKFNLFGGYATQSLGNSTQTLDKTTQSLGNSTQMGSYATESLR